MRILLMTMYWKIAIEDRSFRRLNHSRMIRDRELLWKRRGVFRINDRGKGVHDGTRVLFRF